MVHRFGGIWGPGRATFARAKAKVVELWEGADAELVDAGPLWSARFLEPPTALLWHLGVGLGTGTDIALKLLRRSY